MKCSKCGRQALASVRGGKPKAIKDHDLCQRCWRDQLNAERAGRISRLFVVLFCVAAFAIEGGPLLVACGVMIALSCAGPKAEAPAPKSIDCSPPRSCIVDGGTIVVRPLAAAAPIAPVNVEEEWPYHCTALKVYSVISEKDVRGYYMPVRCVPELSAYPGSILADMSCVPGCVTEGKKACWAKDCSITVTER